MIAPLPAGDIPAAQGLLWVAFHSYSEQLGTDPSQRGMPDLATRFAALDCLGMWQDNHLIGVTLLEIEGREAILSRLAIHPDRQGHGLGTQLLAAAEDRARAKGARVLTLRTLAGFSPLLRFYHRHGFTETHRGPPDHGKDRQIRVHFSKPLQSRTRHKHDLSTSH